MEKQPGPPHRAQPTQAAESVPASKRVPLPQVAPKPSKARVGQRGPGRDPVGETSVPSVRTASGCAFTEVIAVTPSQMEAAEVPRVECPTCLAVRDIHPKGAIVKFPWHPKRVTSTPHHGRRWVKLVGLGAGILAQIISTRYKRLKQPLVEQPATQQAVSQAER